MKCFALIFVLLTSGCIRMQRPVHAGLMAAPPSPRCNNLSGRVLGFNLASVVSGGLGGASATGAALFDGDIRYYLAGGGALFSLAGAVMSYLGGYYAAAYSKECN